MRPVHAALGRRFLVLLDCHELLLKFDSVYCRFSTASELKGDFFVLSSTAARGDLHSPGRCPATIGRQRMASSSTSASTSRLASAWIRSPRSTLSAERPTP